VDLPCCEISGTQVAGTYDQVPAITPEEARDRIDSDCTLLVLDVRNPDEYLGPLGHIRNSLLIPLQELPLRIEEISDYRDCEIISVCKSGGRSSAAAKILIQAGFIRAASMKGGMIQWNENRYPVVTGSQDN
jgi:rhodanese-related sulfurtransferase